ncbi:MULTISPECIES: NAD(P)-binding oxidoreductase [Pseudofrankia]|uniref:NAD(P)-binding oxidoreductase n=1 Tax=Pseudofrankia TaxID=2994363 RepID=UPI000234B9D6|nr:MULTISPECIES: NAD(P)-binding oxidoreductase [Pseudofrankia]OHV30057.1 epimerase [Pseudofrankia sp. EUN1h]
MNVLVVGASRGSGAAAVRALAAEGHRVTAFARSASAADLGPADRDREVVRVDGDVLDAEALAKAMVGQDAVVVTLGISDNPVKVRLARRAATPLDVRSTGTARVVAAMRQVGVPRLVAQTTYGLGAGRRLLPRSLKLVFALLLAPQIRDSERQEEIVRGSGLDWTLIRPVSLTDDQTDAPAHVTTDDTTAGMKVARSQVARVATNALTDPATIHRTLSVSA